MKFYALYVRKGSILTLILIFLNIGLLLPRSVEARKIRKTSIPGANVSGGGYSSVTIFPSRLGIVINFFNLSSVQKISYVLSYSGSGKSQGVVGSFAPSANIDSRELLFGTCSRGACVYHENVQNARLTINFTLKTGGIFTKRYLLKVHK